MNQSYKIVLFGNGIYQEIELKEKKEVKVGTTGACTFRFDQSSFFEDFELDIVNVDDSWKMMCSDNLYIVTDGIVKQYTVSLSHGDTLMVKYQKGNAALFSVSFLIDFDRANHEYDRKINLSEQNEVTIGGTEECDIRINNQLINQDYITLATEKKGYLLTDKKTQYGIYVNGFKIDDKVCRISDYDFFMVSGCQFYIKYGQLYTSSKEVSVSPEIEYTDTLEQLNAMHYPKFNRNSRLKVLVPDEKIEVLMPKAKPTAPEKNMLVTLAPMVMSVVLIVVLRSMMSSNSTFMFYGVAMMGVGVVTSVMTHIAQGKKYREQIRKREKEYTEYAQKQEAKIKKYRVQEKEALEDMYLSTQEEINEAINFDKRLFERGRDDEDYLTLYVGHGKKKAACAVTFKEQDFKDTDDHLTEYPQMLRDEYEYLDDVPLVLDLKEINSIGVIGEKQKQYELLKNFTLDLSIRQFYEDVRLYYIFDEADKARFEWIRWLKNTRLDGDACRNFMYDEESKKIILERLYSQLSFRESLDKDQIADLPSYIIFVSSTEALAKHPVSKYIEKCNELGFTFIFFQEYQELIPKGCDEFIYLTEEPYMVKSSDKAEKCSFQFTPVRDDVASFIAGRLGCVSVDSVNLESSLTSNISLYHLFNICSVEDLDIEKRWAKSKVYESMAAPLGVRSNSSIVALDLHEKHHGPHGLVAGTTGSGKSEILQSYILSMATLFSPDEVGFVIIDFKGGGMVNQFKNLPHLIGAITNIDGREIDRSLLSIKAELKKRQEVFAQYQVNHIDAYIKLYKQGKAGMALPHLILIVDEFAELKSDQPEFMKELISAARIGRSLGVHLILATQKPSGVVDDQIWSNSKFKLCLKVQNKQDSNEVLKSPLAAEIKEPGRAYLQVGNNEIFELFQSAYSGADINADKLGNKNAFKLFSLELSGEPKLIYEQKKNKEKESETQLEAIVNYIDQYCKKKHIERLPGICLPGLAEIIEYQFHQQKEAQTDISVCLGIYDDPSNQLQDELFTNITQNNTFILGSSQYGKTNLLQVIIKGIALQYSPEDIHIYILDFASMILKNFESLKHVGGVITASEDEKLKNFFKMMAEEIENRKNILSELGISSYSAYRDAGYRKLPQILIMIDNMTALRELYLMNEDALLPICREGLAVGISVVMTNQQMAGMGYKYLSNFSNKIALYCNDSAEYSTLYSHCKLKCRNIPGRGICEIDKELYEFQAYLAFQGEKEIDRVKSVRAFIQERNAAVGEKAARKIPEIPDVLTEADAAVIEQKKAAYRIMLGLSYRTVSPVYLNLLQMTQMALTGREAMGKRNFVELLVKSLNSRAEQEPAQVYVFDDVMRTQRALQAYGVVKEYVLETERIKEVLGRIEMALQERYQMMISGGTDYMDQQPYILLVIQNKDVIDTICNDQASLTSYKNLITKYKNMKIGILLSNIDNAAISFSANDILKRIRDNRKCIVMEDIPSIKLIENIPLAVSKAFKKPLRPGDGYYFNGNSIEKIRFIKLNSRDEADKKTEMSGQEQQGQRD